MDQIYDVNIMHIATYMWCNFYGLYCVLLLIGFVTNQYMFIKDKLIQLHALLDMEQILNVDCLAGVDVVQLSMRIKYLPYVRLNIAASHFNICLHLCKSYKDKSMVYQLMGN